MEPDVYDRLYHRTNGTFPHFGLGYKLTLPTGETETRNNDGVINEPDLQPGAGTVDQTIYAGYHQVLDPFMPFCAISYVLTGPESERGYGRADKFNIMGGCAYSFGDNGQYGLQLMLTSATNLDDDYIAESLGKRSLENAGTTVTWQVALNWRPADKVDLKNTIYIPLSEPESDSTTSTDYVLGLS